MPSASAFSSAHSAHLRVDSVSVSFADRRVLTNVSFTVSSGERVGLIGENGSGKSTLLKAIVGLVPTEAGRILAAGTSIPPRLGLLHQSPPFSAEASLSEAIESAVSPARAAVNAVTDCASRLAEEPDGESAERYARALEDVERLDAWTVDARIASTLAGLGLSNVEGHRPTGHLSGGQRARLSLAWLLLRAPDVLLLDEPTNHLDDAAAEYLRRTLLAWRGPVLVASHDRAFLDEIATSLVDLDPSPSPAADLARGATRFTGTYSDYLQARADARARWERQYRDEQAELRRLRASVRDPRVGHREWTPRTETRMAQKYYADRNARVVARRVNDARARLADLQARQIGKPPSTVAFAGLTAAGAPLKDGRILTLSEAAVAGRLAPISLTIDSGRKLLVTGPNGSGKSTLLRLAAGQLMPTSGQRQAMPGASVGILAQETSLDTFNDRTAAEAYVDAVGLERAERTPLSTFGLLAAVDEHRPVAALSLGQRRRLELAMLLADPPDLLLLDEPTNHLSLPLVNALEDAIPEYPGAVVVASHDRWLREHWSDVRLDLSGLAGP